MITVKHKGNFNNFEKWSNRMLKRDYLKSLDKYGLEGVRILSEATPSSSGKTASSWSYSIKSHGNTITIGFSNSNESDGQNIVILLVYGHGTKSGGYVQPNDFVNPAIQPVFEKMANEAWLEVMK